MLLSFAMPGCHLTNMSLPGERSDVANKIVIPDAAAAIPETAAPIASEKAKQTTELQESSPPAEAEGESIQLTLESALEHALRNSKGIQVLTSVPQEVLTGVDIELARFDPALLSGAQFGQSNQQAASIVQALGTNLNVLQATTFGAPGTSTDQLQLQQRWTNGTRAAVGYHSGYNFNNPSGSSCSSIQPGNQDFD